MNINGKSLLSAVLLSLIPAFIGYLLIGIAAGAGENAVSGVLFLILLAGSSYLIYNKQNLKEKTSSMFFFLAIESLLSPLIFLIYTFVFTAENTTGDAEAAGAAIGGTILIAIAFFIGLPLSGVFYLLSRRLSSSSE
jgi:hypothetical protein